MDKVLKIEVGYVIDVAASNLETDTIVVKLKEIESFKELGEIDGYYINRWSLIQRVCNSIPDKTTRNIFPTEADALSSLALSQLLQLRKRVIGDWKPDWNDADIVHILYRTGEVINTGSVNTVYSELSFETKEQVNRFLILHKDLLKQYYKL